MKHRTMWLLLCVSTVLIPVQAFSADATSAADATAISADQTGGIPTPSSVPDTDWHFGVTPYLWFAGVHGAAGPLRRPVSIDATAGDVLSKFNIGIMGAVEARKKRFVYLGDLMWIKLSDDKSKDFVDQTIQAKAKFYEFILSQDVGFRVIDAPKVKVDGIAGFRLWYISAHLNFSGQNNALNFGQSRTWVDPVIGSRILVPFSPKTLVTIYGDVGGWNTGSQLEYQVIGVLGYRIKPKILLQGGWRYLDVNYRDAGQRRGTFLFDVAQSGLMLGATFEIK